MKILPIILILLTTLSVSAATENYEQIISVKYPSQKEAQEATAEIQKLPNGKKIAFSTRWDDSTTRHLDTAKMLKKIGLKATCYLGDISKPELVNMANGVLELGGAIGSHTISHPFLETLLPNQIFKEIALERVILESALDTNVIAFVLPYTTYSSNFDKNVKKYVGLTIFNSGYLAEPEPHKPNKEKYELSEGDILSSNVFAADDRNPQENIYKNNFTNAMKKIASNADAHITLGIHSWQDNAGLERLSSYIKKYHQEQFWYCNENEYSAYRTQFLNSKIEKIDIENNVARFKLTRPKATNLGSDIGLFVSFSGKPKAVAADKEILNLEDTQVQIPHPKKFTCPKKIDWIENKNNENKPFASKKFDGISGVLIYDSQSQKLTALLKNESKKPIENLEVIFRNAPCYEFEKAPIKFKTVNKSATVKPSIKLIENDYAKDFETGEKFFIAQCDFLYNGEPSRVWLTTSQKNSEKLDGSPRDCAVFISAFDESLVSDSDIQKLAQSKSKLPKLKNFKWNNSENYNLREFHINFNTYAPMGKFPKGNFRAIYCFDVIAPEKKSYELDCSANSIKNIFVNGVKLEKLSNKMNVELSKGKNRILIELGKTSMRTKVPGIILKDAVEPLKCVTPEFEE